ncbi:hypothetical protein DICVIV_07148 [Dictyocaulus viviparus]|uniref:Headcase N-terminal domain-containing protein n=1 Tax=Dictyocaulus viviparus TaxID=29172 RepID=A0A0D8XQ61_DICVI|nr:hypothetical protein DICVIV_07148 [Dictyocaulus viviparus]
MGSARKNDKARSKDKDRKATSVHPTPLIPKVHGCPVPDPIRCFEGKPLPIGDEGVTMKCSNEKCPFENVLLHERCFEAFEHHLVKVLSNLGSARGWTDAQRRANLWDKKGQSLIAKVCRCRCGLGLTKVDELAAYNRLKSKTQEQAPREATIVEGRQTGHLKKKHKAKSALPKLNFGSVKTPYKATAEEREARTLTRKHGVIPRDKSSSSMSSTPTSYFTFEPRRESLTYASDAWGVLSTLTSSTKTQSLNNGKITSCSIAVMSSHLADHDDTISTSSKNDCTQDSSNDLSSAPLCHTMSYDSIAMKHGESLINDHLTSSPFMNVSVNMQAEMLGHENGIEQKCSLTASSECGEQMSYKDGASLKDCVMTLPPFASLPLRNTQDIILSANFTNHECVSSTERLEKLGR